MTQDKNALISWERRLEMVERENRRLKLFGALAVLVGAGVLCMGLAATPSKKIEAEVFVVKDPHGKARMVLAVGEDGPAITMIDKNGKLRVNLEATDEGTALDLLDRAESPRAQLMVNEDQGPLLNFTDSKGAQVSLKP